MGIYLRVGDSFVADVNRFGAAVTYATDNDVQIVQEALGTLNNSSLAREAVDYAYRHGVVRHGLRRRRGRAAQQLAVEPAARDRRQLGHARARSRRRTSRISPFNGCTNFSAKITRRDPEHVSCSSNAVGLAAGYRRADLQRRPQRARRRRPRPYPDHVDLPAGQRRPLSDHAERDPAGARLRDRRRDPAGRRRRLRRIAGGLGQRALVLADAAARLHQSLRTRRRSAGTRSTPTARLPGPPVAVDELPGPQGVRPVLRLRAGEHEPRRQGRSSTTRSARPGRAAARGRDHLARAGSPRSTRPGRRSTSRARSTRAATPTAARSSSRPGQYPNNALTHRDATRRLRSRSSNGYCDGSTVQQRCGGGRSRRRARLDRRRRPEARFPAGTDFTGPIPTASPATGNGRPFFAPHALHLQGRRHPDEPGHARTGEDQRTAYLHRDQDLLDGFPRTISAGGSIGGPTATPTADGDSSPAFADLDGDNRNELVFADSDGFVHAISSDGSELPGWPVRGDAARLRQVARRLAAPTPTASAPTSAAPSSAPSPSTTPTVTAIPEVYAADVEGKVYGWAPDGTRVFTEQSNPAYSGKPLTPFVNVRNGKTNRTQHGFFGAPVIADLDGDGRRRDDRGVDGPPRLRLEQRRLRPERSAAPPTRPATRSSSSTPRRLPSVDPQTHAITFSADAGSLMQGAIVDTPAVGDVTGDGRAGDDRRDQRGVRRDVQLGNPGGLGLLLGAASSTPGTRGSSP